MKFTPLAWSVQLLHAWKSLQVSYYGGKYSLARALALEAYAEHTSLWRVCFVMTITLLPMIIVVVAQEMVPLQDPTAGWSNNYGFWIRVMVMSGFGTYILVAQATCFIDGVRISVFRQISVSVCASLCFTVFTSLMALYWVFPIPFFVLLTSPAFAVAQLVSFPLVLGTKVVQHVLLQRDRLLKYVKIFHAEVLMLYVYFAYEAVYRIANGSNFRFLVILLLPALKVITKNIVLRCTLHREDLAPEEVIFTVDFFGAMYMATCMQITSSSFAIVVMVATDSLQTIATVYGLHKCTATIKSRVTDAVGPNLCGNGNIMAEMRRLRQSPATFNKKIDSDIRIRSCLPVCSHVMQLVELLENAQKEVAREPLSPRREVSSKMTRTFVLDSHKPRLFCRSTSKSSVQPFVPVLAPNGAAPNVKNPTILRETLETFFTIECLVATAYLETAISLLYPCYIVLITQLPSSRYHMELTGITSENVAATVLPVFLFGLLQVFSFIVLGAIIKQNCGISALHQLAFVLETQMPLIQGKLITWTVMSMCFRVVHFGVDFTFKFDWTS